MLIQCVPIELLSTQCAVDPMCVPIELLSTQCDVDLCVCVCVHVHASCSCVVCVVILTDDANILFVWFIK